MLKAMGHHHGQRDVVVAAGTAVPAALGKVMGIALGVAGRLRRGKPLHPRGELFRGRLTVAGTGRGWGVPLLDDPSESDVLVRVSRAMGLPGGLPDIHGVAVRLPQPDRKPVDLLFATTGTGPLTRYVLRLRRSDRKSMTTLLPVHTSTGALALRLTPVPQDGGRAWALSAARPGERLWQPVGTLVADAHPVAPDPDPPLRFDPVRNLPDGVEQYAWVRRLRDPAYVLARRWSPASTWTGRRSAAAVSRRDTRSSEWSGSHREPRP